MIFSKSIVRGRHKKENTAPKSYQVLVVCTGNICRSPMGEALLRLRLPDALGGIGIRVGSAGTHAMDGNRAAFEAILAMQDEGIDITRHKSRLINKVLLRHTDRIFVMEAMHRGFIIKRFKYPAERIHLISAFGPRKELVDIPDPYGDSVTAFKKCAALLAECLPGLVDFIKNDIRSQTSRDRVR